MNKFNQDFNLLGPEDYINSLIVVKGIRKAYLIQNFSDTDIEIKERIENIQQVFPRLQLLINQNYNYLSLEKLTKKQVDNNDKIAKILHFDCSSSFDTINRDEEYIVYNIIVTLTNQQVIHLITYICQDDTTYENAEKLTNKIREVIFNHEYLKNIVKDVELDMKIIQPLSSLVDKIANPKIRLNEDEIERIREVIYNIMNKENYDKIVDIIEYNNPIHRGFILSFIATLEFDPLTPLFPLQLSGYMEEIYDIENKRTELLVSLLKKTSQNQMKAGYKNKHKTKKKN